MRSHHFVHDRWRAFAKFQHVSGTLASSLERFREDVMLPQSIAVPLRLILCCGMVFGTSVSAQEVHSLKSLRMHTHAHGHTLPREAVLLLRRTVLRVRQLLPHEDGFAIRIHLRASHCFQSVTPVPAAPRKYQHWTDHSAIAPGECIARQACPHPAAAGTKRRNSHTHTAGA